MEDDTIVRIGSRVRVRDEQGEVEFVLVPHDEADAIADRVSSESPMARAILGRRVGERIRFRAPSGVLGVVVLQVGDGLDA